MKTRRTYRRKPLKRDVIFTVAGIEYRGFGEDIGAGGMFIETNDRFPVGEKVFLTFPLSDEKKQAKLHAEVIRSTNKGIGVRFLRLKNEIIMKNRRALG